MSKVEGWLLVKLCMCISGVGGSCLGQVLAESSTKVVRYMRPCARQCNATPKKKITRASIPFLA